MQMIQKITVAIVDDQKLIIDGLMSLLQESEEIEVVGFSTNGNQVKELLACKNPTVVLLDYRFPDLPRDGIEIAEEMLSYYPDAKFLMLTSYDEFALVKEALKKGIKGYLLKNTGTEELIFAIKQVAAGHAYLGPHVQQKIINTWENEGQNGIQNPFGKPLKKGNIDHPLTKRELEVARHYAAGKARKKIAKDLFISTNTVDTHLKNTFGKLNVKNVAELINYLMDKGLR